jgi:DNA-binding protein YbaB
MSIDPNELTMQLRAAFQDARPPGPFTGAAPGVSVEVTADGELLDLTFDEPVYQTEDTAELSAAIVAAHRTARQTALAGKRNAVFTVLDRAGVIAAAKGRSA